MSDQADGLRQLVKARPGTAPTSTPSPTEPAGRCRSIVLTSGKGGVGTSNLALNLAIALGGRGSRVVLVDADLGLASIDLLCGLVPGRDLGDVLAGEADVVDALVGGPGGIRVLPGAHASRTLPEVLARGPARLVEGLARLESEADYLVVDAGSGLGDAIGALASAGDEVAVVATPEPAAEAAAHASIARLRRLPKSPRLGAVVSQARSSREALEVLDRIAAQARQFLGAAVEPLGFVRADPEVRRAVLTRRPFALARPDAVASRDVRRLALDLIDRGAGRHRPKGPGFFASVASRWALARVASL